MCVCPFFFLHSSQVVTKDVVTIPALNVPVWSVLVSRIRTFKKSGRGGVEILHECLSSPARQEAEQWQTAKKYIVLAPLKQYVLRLNTQMWIRCLNTLFFFKPPVRLSVKMNSPDLNLKTWRQLYYILVKRGHKMSATIASLLQPFTY